MNNFIERYGSEWLQAAPLSLSVNTETPESIVAKLGGRTDLLPHESRQSYFLMTFWWLNFFGKRGISGWKKSVWLILVQKQIFNTQ